MNYKRMKIPFIVFAVVVIILVASWSFSSLGLGNNNGRVSTMLNSAGVGAPSVAYDMYGDYGYDEAQAEKGYIGILPPEEPVPALGDISTITERKVIKNGYVSLVVLKTEEAIEYIKGLATGLGGFVESANVWETGDDKKAGSIIIKVPSDNFDTAISQIKNAAIKVERENITTRDVTEEYIDLDAQLKNLKAAEEQYLQVLARAKDVEEILSVRTRIDQVRSDIERLQGRINYLSRQVDMSTISVELVSEADVEVFGIVWSPLQELKEGLRNLLQGFVGFVNALIALLFQLPIILLWIGFFGAVIYGLVKIALYARNKFIP